MPMYAPAHPGRLVRSDLEALGLSVAEGARALGVTRQNLYRLLNCQAAVSPEMAIRLEAVIGSTADHWMRLQTAYDLAQARQKNAEIIRGLRRLQPV